MYDALFDYFETKSSMILSDAEKEVIKAGFGQKKLRRRQYFLLEGDVCKLMGFIVQGSSRTYSVDKNDTEYVLSLGIENWWIGDYESYFRETPTPYYVEMLEDSQILTVSKKTITEMKLAVPAVGEALKAVDLQNAIKTRQRVHASIRLTAVERYQELSKAYPVFLKRFPQNMIASYLGITPETLSRIKKNAKNE